MKKVSKILFFTFLGTVLLAVVLGMIFGGASAIGSFVGGIHNGYVDFWRESEKGTQILLYSMFAFFYAALAYLFAVQIRRKKSKMFPIYSAMLLTVVLLTIFGRSYLIDFIKDGKPVKVIFGVGFGGLAVIELLALAVTSVPACFEHSEIQSNAKKSDGYKLIDVIVGAAVTALFVLALAIISGGKFEVFKGVFSTSHISVLIVLIIEVFVFGFFIYRLFKQKKPIAAILFPLAVLAFEFEMWTYNYYGWTLLQGVSKCLEGSIVEQLEGTFILTHFGVMAAYGLYISADYLVTIFEARRQKLYNHREKYVYGDRRKFGDSVVKEWEASKAQAAGGMSFADIAAAIEAQKAADLRESQGLQGLIVNEDDITNNDEVQAGLQAEQSGDELISANEAAEDDADDKKAKFALVNGSEPTEFREKLMTLDGNKRGRYNKIRNRLMSYKKIKQKFSKTVDTYRYAGELVAKVSIIGSTLRLHLALDPDSYDVNKYHHIDLSAKQKYIFVPFTLKLKGPKSVDLAIQLIDELMKGFEIPQDKKYVDQDYAKQVAEELKAEGLLVEVKDDVVADETAATAEAPVAEEAPAAEETPATEEAPVVDETPTVEE